MSVTLHEPIERIVGERPTRIQPLHGGMIGEVYQIDFAVHEPLVAKVANPPFGQLDIEGYMLRYLRGHSTLPVPTVIHSENTLLLMTHIPGNSQISASVQRHAAEILAELHQVRGDQFGLERDTLIGSLPQPNPPTDSWIDFFRDQRLLFMARGALGDGRLNVSLYTRIEQLAERLEDYLEEPPHPSLIHGDLWTTNILAHDGKITGFIDPALYYGHPEIELAYTTLFGTFGEPFFKRYTQLRPITPGFFEVRREIYNLYPLLVHVRIFGGGYTNSVAGSLSRIGF